MDLNDFWQENKRWVLGCVAGLLVFLIARMIVDGRFNAPARAAVGKTRGIYSSVAKGEKYLEKHEAAARAERDRLDATLQVLRAAMHYELPKRFDLAGKGDAELYRATVFSEVRTAAVERAAAANVEFPEDGLSWSPQTERDAIQRELIGISLVDHVVAQLIAAHKAVLEADFEALGVRSIVSFKMDSRPRKSRVVRSNRDEGVRAADLVSEVAVGFVFEADFRTTELFLENCRAAEPKVTFGRLKITRGKRSGEPLRVDGEVRALSVKPLPSP
jgi:hypothetical protein